MTDYLNLDDKLTEEERNIRDTAREFVREELKPNLGEWFERGEFPDWVIPEFGELGFYAPNLDGYGLPDVSERAYGLVMTELEAGDSGLRSMASVQGALVMYPIRAFGTNAQKEYYLPKLATGDAIGCFGLTEPEHGSDPASMTTRAERDGDDWLLYGTKTWITNADVADVALVWARDESEEGDGTIRGFLVPTDEEGVETHAIDEKLSMRVSHTGTVVCDGVRIPDRYRLPDVEGMKGPLSCLTQARYGIAWGAVGAARDSYHEALEYAKDRTQWGKPIGGFQLQQEKLTEMVTQISTGQLLAHRLAELKEAGELRAQQVSMAKRQNVRMARDQSRVAREILGGNGITYDYSPMRHMANMETVYTYEGTHDIHSLIVGADITGLRAFRG